jgi:hypothetical protein
MERDWTILLAGVFSQQLSNAPQQTFDEGRFTAAIPELMAMFADHYSPARRRRKQAATRGDADRFRHDQGTTNRGNDAQ